MPDENYDQIEERMIQEEQEKRKEKMPVSGRSVFKLQKIKEERTGKINQRGGKPAIPCRLGGSRI